MQEIENVTYSNEKFNKKYNPYTLREQNFFNNQERKQKIDMKPFIEWSIFYSMRNTLHDER